MEGEEYNQEECRYQTSVVQLYNCIKKDNIQKLQCISMYVQNSIRNIRDQVLTYLIFLPLKSFSLTFYIYFISAASPPITDPGKSGNLMEKYNDQKEQTI